MAQPALRGASEFHVPPGRWTAQRALAELPETTEMTIEVIDGSLVMTPRPELKHARAIRDLAYLMHQSARTAGMQALPEINLVVGEDLTSPDITVAGGAAADGVWLDASVAVLVVEIMSSGSRRKDRIERPAIYAEAGIRHYLRVEFRGEDPVMLLHELVDGEYRPIVVAAAGTTFTMHEPFEFAIDPAELLDT
jgi:Uma2 family endonuclease